MATATEDPAATWINYQEAARELGLDPNTVRRLVDQGQLIVRKIPGCHPRLNLADIRAFAERFTQRPVA